MDMDKIGSKLLRLMGREDLSNSFSSKWLKEKSGFSPDQLNAGIEFLAKNGAVQIIQRPNTSPYLFSNIILLPRGKYLYSYVVEQSNVMRISKNQEEIFKLLMKIQSINTQVNLWQKSTSEVNISYAEITKIDRKSNKLGFIITKAKDGEKLKIGHPINVYIRLPDQSILFRADIQIIGAQNSIVINLPKEIRIMEKRATSRYIFSSHDRKEVLISRVSEASYSSKIRFQLSDLSNLGIALTVLPSAIDSFNPEDHFLIHKISNEKFMPPIQAKVVYVAKSEYKKKKRFFKAFKVGFRFYEEISSGVINRINVDDQKNKDDKKAS